MSISMVYKIPPGGGGGEVNHIQPVAYVAIFSYANILKIKRIKRNHIKGIGSPLLISNNVILEK